jgi:hypothetical protein
MAHCAAAGSAKTNVTAAATRIKNNAMRRAFISMKSRVHLDQIP